jgi:hypothetical protein
MSNTFQDKFKGKITKIDKMGMKEIVKTNASPISKVPSTQGQPKDQQNRTIALF